MSRQNREMIFQREFDQLRTLKKAARTEDISTKRLQTITDYVMTLAEKVIRDSTKLAEISDISERRLLRAQKAMRERKAQLETALTQVKTLAGLIPVCAHCKKVRNEKGYWELVETYLSDHTDADVTAALCEECEAKLFPGSSKRPERRTDP